MRKVSGSRETYQSDGGYGRMDGEIVIERREVIATIPYGPDGTGPNPMEAAWMRAGEYLADNATENGAILRWDYRGRAYAATLEPLDANER